MSPDSDSLDQSSDDDWIEKTTQETGEESSPLTILESKEQNAREIDQMDEQVNQKDDWLMPGSFLDTVMSSSESQADRRAKKMEEKKKFMKPAIDELGQHRNELNPYWKDGGSGIPKGIPEKGPGTQRDRKVGDAGLSWVKKAYERAKEQAEEQGRSLEDVVAERFGSMEKLNALLRNEESKKRQTNDGENRRGWRSKDSRECQLRDRWRRTDERSSADFGEKSEMNNEERQRQRSEQENILDKRPVHNILSKSDEKKSPKARAEGGSSPQQITLVKNQTTEERTNRVTDSSSESDIGESSGSEDDTAEFPKNTEPLSEKDINEISAKILRAELLGDQELADKLKAKLEAGRQQSSGKALKTKKESKRGIMVEEKEEEVILTRTDKHGNIYPLQVSGEEPEPRKKRRKVKAIETHDTKGNRLRYFQEDDTTDLKSMVEEERLTTAEDHQFAVMSRLTKKLGSAVSEHYTLDDMFETSSATKESRSRKDEKAKKRAIAEQQKAMAKQSNCRFCFDNPDVAKHLIISVASHVYLALPITSSLTEGHCLIIPTQHTSAATYLDENIMEEVTKFKRCLTNMFKDKDQDVIFLETAKNLKFQRHMLIECIPVPRDVGDVAPIYFKKAIEESESEWAQNQKLVEVSKIKGIKAAIPKGLPYFSVEFGMDGGYAHVIEDEAVFQNCFGKEIIGGILDLEPMKWRKPPKESFQKHKRKVLNFSEIWEPFDWTRDL